MNSEDKRYLFTLAEDVATGAAGFAETKEMILDEMGEEAFQYFMSQYIQLK